MNALIDAALAVAQKYPVFPTTFDKLPCWSNAALGLAKGQGGFKIATRDPARIRELFAHPKAVAVSVPMGPMSGLLAVDPDLYKGLHVVRWHEANKHWLEKTLCHKTKNGGLHYIFKWTDEVRFPSTLADGVDVKGNGGYIVFPPSGGYTVHAKKPVAVFPIDVLQAVMRLRGGTGNVIQLGSYNDATDDDLIKRIQDGTEIYPALRSLSFRMPSRRQSDGTYLTQAEMIRILENLMDTSVAASPSHARHGDWVDRRGKITELVTTAAAKEAGLDILSPEEIVAIAQGESFIKAQLAIGQSVRPMGPQRETTISDIEKRVAVKNQEEKDKTDTKNTEAYVRVNAEQLNAVTLPRIEWVVKGMIPQGGMVSIAGMSNVGKTRWIAALVVALAVGDTKRIGLPPCEKKVTTLWVANEERTEDICRRLKAVLRQHGDKESAPIVIRGKGSGMMRLVAMNEAGTLEIDEDSIAELVTQIREAGADMVVFDPYVTLSDAADENSSSSAAMLTKAFLLLTTMTGAACMHAHHTPKDRSLANDWVRGNSGAWRGSGAIYSGLDCGYTLSHWMPAGKDQKKAWQQQYLTSKLSRFIVLDTAKIREGEALEPVVMELVPQEMADGEGDPIGVCKVVDEATAHNALLESSIDAIAATSLANAMITTLGEGEHTNMTECSRKMGGHELWPDASKTEGKDKLLEMFGEVYRTADGSVHVTNNASRKWRITITENA